MAFKTKRGYDFYEVSSSLQKAIRRNDVKVAGYMALELFPFQAEYVWRRLLTISAEDVHGVITTEIKSLYDSFWIVNKNKKRDELGGRIFITKAVMILCHAMKNRDADVLQNYVYDKKISITDEEIQKYFTEVREEHIDIPEYAYDVHTLKGKRMGKTKRDFMIEEEQGLSPNDDSIKVFNIFDLLEEEEDRNGEQRRKKTR